MNPTSMKDTPPTSEQSGSKVPSTARTEHVKTSMEETVAIRSSAESPSTRHIARANHVFFGKAKWASQGPGNQRMHRIINKYNDFYVGGSQEVKRRLVKKAFNEIVEGGVIFFKQVGSEWVEVGKEAAMEKVAYELLRRRRSPQGTSSQGFSTNEMVDSSSPGLNPSVEHRSGHLGSTIPPTAGIAHGDSSKKEKIVAIRRTGSSETSHIARANHIFFGRGKGCFQSPGNNRMRRIIDAYKDQYIGSSRTVKRSVLKKVFDEIAEGDVMFLKQAGDGSEWVEVEHEDAIRKVAHSLRWRRDPTAWRKDPTAGIQESPANHHMMGSNTQDNSPASGIANHRISQGIMTHQQIVNEHQDNTAASASMKHRPEMSQGITTHQESVNEHQQPSAVTANQSEAEALRQTIVAQQQALRSEQSMRAILFQQLQDERMRTRALAGIPSVPLLQPAVASIPELEAQRAIEQERFRWIMASCGNKWLRPGL